MVTQTWIYSSYIEYDREATAQAYSQPVYVCDCAYCRNFMAAISNLPPVIISILEKFGIDPQKPAEIVEFGANSDDSHQYLWWYHLNGTIIEGDGARTTLEEGVEMLIRIKADIVMDNFPIPIIQVEFFADLPWVLEEPYPRF